MKHSNFHMKFTRVRDKLVYLKDYIYNSLSNHISKRIEANETNNLHKCRESILKICHVLLLTLYYMKTQVQVLT